MYIIDDSVNFMDVDVIGSNTVSFQCRTVYLTSMLMYKPLFPSMFMVLVATSHLAYWKRVHTLIPKKQTNVLPGTPIPDNYISGFLVNIAVTGGALWFSSAAYFAPLSLFLFLPLSLVIIFAIPVILMKCKILRVPENEPLISKRLTHFCSS